jgi:hypothetical protein
VRGNFLYRFPLAMFGNTKQKYSITKHTWAIQEHSVEFGYGARQPLNILTCIFHPAARQPLNILTCSLRHGAGLGLDGVGRFVQFICEKNNCKILNKTLYKTRYL